MLNGCKVSQEFFEKENRLTGSQSNSLTILRDWSSVSLRTTIEGT